MNKTNNPKLTENSKFLRKNMTKQERHLWYDFLKTLPITFHRQKVLGNYIVDFYCASKNLSLNLMVRNISKTRENPKMKLEINI